MASEVIERKLYGNSVHIVHNPNARGSAPRYKILDINGNIVKKPKGVTTIMGKVLAKDLMDWAISCCIEELKTKLPVVTEADLAKAAKAYTTKRDKGANTGTEAHALVEQFLKGTGDTNGASQEARNAFHGFLDWFNEFQPQVLGVEEVIYSKAYEYAGTYDCLLKIDGKVVLCDFKTTNASRQAPNGVYADYFIQLGAYAAAHEENRLNSLLEGGDKIPEIEDLAVLSGKKNGKFDVVYASELGIDVQTCGDMFKRVANLYSFQTNLTQLLGGK